MLPQEGVAVAAVEQNGNIFRVELNCPAVIFDCFFILIQVA
jgi:hypothetical protein